MAAADPLLNPLRVPRQIVVNHQRTELQVDSLRPRFRCNQNFRPIPEAVYQRVSEHDRLAAGGVDIGVVSVLRHVFGIDLFRLRIAFPSAGKTDDITGVTILLQIVPQILHGAARFRENHRFLFRTQLPHLLPAAFQCGEQVSGFGIGPHIAGPGDETIHLLNLRLEFFVIDLFDFAFSRRSVVLQAESTILCVLLRNH